jgi:hypothetical protein
MLPGTACRVFIVERAGERGVRARRHRQARHATIFGLEHVSKATLCGSGCSSMYASAASTPQRRDDALAETDLVLETGSNGSGDDAGSETGQLDRLNATSVSTGRH